MVRTVSVAASSMSSVTKIPIHVSNKKAYIWDVDDAANLRRSHHILGLLTGTLPSLSQQNVFLGLPLLLMPEEVVLLVEGGTCALVDDATAFRPPKDEELSAWKDSVIADRTNRLQALDSIRIAKEKSREMNITDEMLQKRKAREAKRMQALTAALDAGSSHKGGAADSAGLADLLAPELERPSEDTALKLGSSSPTPHSSDVPDTKEVDSFPPVAPLPAHTIVIPESSKDHSWFKPKSYETLDEARVAGIWTYPSTSIERAKCAVYRDLHQQGYFMGGGMKFGGDWLVYPGDLLRYHSHFVATVYETSVSELTPMQIVAHGRLGTGTKKAHLLCGWDETSGKIDYYSIEWANFG